MIADIRKNSMGTISFNALFPGQRKAQDFIVYPVSSESGAARILVQSDKRIGYIHMADGRVELCPSQPGGAYNHHLIIRQPLGRLPSHELLLLKSHIMATAHGSAGKAENGIIQADNSGAINIFGAQA